MADNASRLCGVQDHQSLIEVVLSRVGSSVFPGVIAEDFVVKENSGTSGAKTYFITRVDRAAVAAAPEAVHRDHSNTVVLKIEAPKKGSDDSAEAGPFSITEARRAAFNGLVKAHSLHPATLCQGHDYTIDPFLGVSVGTRCDYHPEKASLKQVAHLLAKLHALPTAWFDASDDNGGPSIRQRIIDRDPRLSETLHQQPHYSHCWQFCMGLEHGQFPPWDDKGAVYEMLLEPQPSEPAGVYGKFLSCAAFHPMSSSGQRVVNIHGDFKADNMLLDQRTNELVPIDFDGSTVGAAVADFGFMLMRNGYLRTGPKSQNRGLSKPQLRDQRLLFLQTYLEAAGTSFDGTLEAEAKALLLDTQIFTLVVNSGLLTNWGECEIALLRGREHPTREGPCTNLETPFGSELVDLFAEAVTEIRGSEAAREAVLLDEIIPTMLDGKHVMVGEKGEVLRKYLKHIIENDIL